MNRNYYRLNLEGSIFWQREKDGTYVRNRKGGYQLSRRRMRDFGFFVKNFDSNSFKSPLRYNHTNNHDKLIV